MSIGALLRGSEKQLRSESVLDDSPEEAVGKFVGIHPSPGKPPARFGQYYIALHWSGSRGADANPQRHDVYHGLIATLTARLNYAPKDRQGVRLTTAADLYDLVDIIAGPNVIHGSWALINSANEFIVGSAAWAALDDARTATVNGFTEPLVLDSFGPERPASADWLGGTETKDVYVIDIRFREARRIRPYTG